MNSFLMVIQVSSAWEDKLTNITEKLVLAADVSEHIDTSLVHICTRRAFPLLHSIILSNRHFVATSRCLRTTSTSIEAMIYIFQRKSGL